MTELMKNYILSTGNAHCTVLHGIVLHLLSDHVCVFLTLSSRGTHKNFAQLLRDILN